MVARWEGPGHDPCRQEPGGDPYGESKLPCERPGAGQWLVYCLLLMAVACLLWWVAEGMAG